MRVTDVPKTIAPRSVSDANALRSSELSGVLSGFDLGFLPTRGELCALMGRAANALAALFGDDTSGVGSIVDFGDGKRGNGKSIVDFGDRPASIVDFGDGKAPTE